MTFNVTKDISPEKITGYTFQGVPIVIGKRRGRPPKTRAKPGWFPVEKKVQAACLYAVTGSLKEVSRLTDISEGQLRSMMDQQWWEDTIKQVRREENDLITAKMTTVIEKSLDAVLDRLENGEYIYDARKGEIVRVPVKLRDISYPVGVLSDKRQLLRGEVTSRTEKLGQDELLKQLGEKFEQFAKTLNKPAPEPIETEYTEIIDESKKEESAV